MIGNDSSVKFGGRDGQQLSQWIVTSGSRRCQQRCARGSGPPFHFREEPGGGRILHRAISASELPGERGLCAWIDVAGRAVGHARNARGEPSGRVARGSCPPRAPTDPDLRVDRVSGSSRRGIAVPRTIRWFRGDTLMRLDVLGVVPTACPTTRHPLRSTGSGRARSPASSLIWGAPTPCRPSRRTSFPSLGDTIVRPLFVPTSSGQSCGSTWSC